MSEKIRYLKLPGRGQRETPVGDIYVRVMFHKKPRRALCHTVPNGIRSRQTEEDEDEEEG